MLGMALLLPFPHTKDDVTIHSRNILVIEIPVSFQVARIYSYATLVFPTIWDFLPFLHYRFSYNNDIVTPY